MCVGFCLSDECVDYVVVFFGCRWGEVVDYEQQGLVVWVQFEYGFVYCVGVEEGFGSYGFRYWGFFLVCGFYVWFEYCQ